jgi:hypothetical protein
MQFRPQFDWDFLREGDQGERCVITIASRCMGVSSSTDRTLPCRFQKKYCTELKGVMFNSAHRDRKNSRGCFRRKEGEEEVVVFSAAGALI